MNILLAIDDSNFSQQAVDTLVAQQLPDDSRIRVVTVIDSSGKLPVPDDQKQKAAEEAQALVNQAVSTLKEKFPAENVTGEVLDGYTKERLLTEIGNWPADMIVVGSHGRHGLSHLLLGSVSQALLHHSPCTVLIVKAGDEISSVNGAQFKNVVVALDESEYSDRALQRVLNAPWPDGAKIHLVTVVETFRDSILYEWAPDKEREAYKEYVRKLKVKALEFLTERAAPLKNKFGEDMVFRHVLEGDAREKIVCLLKEEHPDLIVMGSHGRSGLEFLRLGSVSEAVAHHCNCSVEVVKS